MVRPPANPNLANLKIASLLFVTSQALVANRVFAYNRDGLTVKGRPWRDYLRDVSYRNEIPIFKEYLKKIGDIQGWTLSEAQGTFSNPLLDHIFF